MSVRQPLQGYEPLSIADFEADKDQGLLEDDIAAHTRHIDKLRHRLNLFGALLAISVVFNAVFVLSLSSLAGKDWIRWRGAKPMWCTPDLISS